MKFKEYLLTNQGATITKMSAGGGAGSIILMELNNGNCFWIPCYWELYKDTVIICSCEDDTTAIIGKVPQTLKKLEGLKITKVEFDKKRKLLLINFADSYQLFVCPDDDEYENWSMWLPKQNLSYTISPKKKIIRGTYS